MNTNSVERRALTGLEFRAAEDGKPATLRGYAAVFNKPSLDLGGFIEVVRKGAFSRALSDGSEILALAHHDTRLVLARRSAGTLTLTEDDVGLLVEIKLAETSHARDVAEDVRARNIEGMSFGFVTRRDAWTAGENGQPDVRELLDVELIEVSPVAIPAYPDTSIATRSRPSKPAPEAKSENDPAVMRRLNGLRIRLLETLPS